VSNAVGQFQLVFLGRPAGCERVGSTSVRGSSCTKNYCHLGSYHDLVYTYISGNGFSFLDDESHEKWMEADLSQRLESWTRVRDLDIGLTTSHKYQQHVMNDMMMKEWVNIALHRR